jgi:serine/threonine-protein kinase HipA
MNRCPLTYEPLQPGEVVYSRRGLQRLARTLTGLDDLPWSAEEQRLEAGRRATKLSIQGVQPKLSAILRPKAQRFEIVDRGGTYILKPPHAQYPNVPENEDLTMRLAEAGGIEVPAHGLVRGRDGSWTYFIRRFDRLPRGRKVAVEDFAQLAGRTRETKYDASMEQVARVIEQYTTFPQVEKLALLRRTLFCFLTGGEDMHLKNFSVITRGTKIQLAPAYDLLNTSIILPAAQEELALPLNGKKRNLRRKDLLDYFAIERLGLTWAAVNRVVVALESARPRWERWITVSFLPEAPKGAYLELMRKRFERLMG